MGVTNAGGFRGGVERLPFGGGPRFFFWLVMGIRRATDVLPRLVRHLDVELDRRELVGRLSQPAQERERARIFMDVGEHWVDRNRAEAGIRYCTALSSHANARSASPRKAST